MKLPDDVRQELIRRFQNKHREWLVPCPSIETENTRWPLEINLGIPTEVAALKQPEGIRAWVTAWQNWRGVGSLVWSDRRWRSLGAQSLPDKLVLNGPADVALWIGEAARWECASLRHAELTARWPSLERLLPRHFDVLADYSDADYQRLYRMLEWIIANPNSNLYPRQLPIAGLDSKWLEGRKGLLSDLVATIKGDTSERDFFLLCGLKPLPYPIRMRVLDQEIRNQIGGLGDISAHCDELAALNLSVSRVFVVENLQTGLAFPDVPGTVVIMRLGYNVDVLARLPWITKAKCMYWGDLDTHGFAILNRARTYLPLLQSLLMDEETLLSHKTLWVDEKQQNAAEELPLLTDAEQAVYRGIKKHQWGQNIRLEQERIAWDYAWNSLAR
ncbi:MAG: DUF2220 family protein [Sulfuricella sp.]|nr:DUF2220 family protein [Sulfuricella sp.]